MTREQFGKIFIYARRSTLDLFYQPVMEAMAVYAINTPKRQAMFLAQLCHESGSLRYVEEIASGAAYDTGSLAKRLGNTPEADGDGQRFKGRGLIQITGRDNYERVSEAFKVDFVADPEKLEEPKYAALSAAWFWNWKQLNRFADASDLKGCTKIINGGLNGLADREDHWKRAKLVLGVK